MKLYQKLAQLIQARANCNNVCNQEWFHKHEDRIEELVKEHMPAGGGFDSGTHIDFIKSTSESLVFTTAFHHMNEIGYYDGWTEHTVKVTPSLQWGFELKISGRNRNDIKDYMHEVFNTTLADIEITD